jgi:hypothetical protein
VVVLPNANAPVDGHIAATMASTANTAMRAVHRRACRPCRRCVRPRRDPATIPPIVVYPSWLAELSCRVPSSKGAGLTTGSSRAPVTEVTARESTPPRVAGRTVQENHSLRQHGA